MAEPSRAGWRTRLLSGIALALAGLTLVYVGGPALAALVALALAAVALEWNRMAAGGRAGASAAVTVAVIGGTVAASVLSGALLALAVAAGGAVLVALVSLATRASALWCAAGAFYLSAAALAFLWLRSEPGTGRAVVFWLLAVVWTTDIVAYGVGGALKGPRLAPRLSPQKTWAGALAGAASAVLAGLFMGWLLSRVGWLPALPGPRALALSALGLSAVAQAGDLGESAFKRRFGVKDSGHLIPGHGGAFDRLDSLLAAAPALGLLELAGGGAFGSAS